MTVLSRSVPIQLHDTVVATVDCPEYAVLAGDIGTVVEVYSTPDVVYDVEFVNADDTMRALLTFAPYQVRRLTGSDVLTTRQLPLAA